MNKDLNKDRQIIDILIKKTEELLNQNTHYFLERVKLFLYMQAEAKERGADSVKAAEPVGFYGSDEQCDPDEVDHLFLSNLSNSFDLDNLMVIDSMKEDLADLGLIKPKKQEKIDIRLEDFEA